MEYLFYERKIEPKDFSDNLIQSVLFSSEITKEDKYVNIKLYASANEED
jgi:hypothetical protein